MAVKATYVWALAELISSNIGHSHLTDLLEAASRTRPKCNRVRQSHAEVSDTDEPAVGKCPDRHHGTDWPKDLTGNSGRRT